MKERRLRVPGRFENLAQIADFVAAVVRDGGWDDDQVFHVQMAVDEACSNVIEHAYGADVAGDIELICCTEDNGDLVVQIRDEGRPFDPSSVPEPTIGPDLDNLQAGGLGLYFMRKLMDQVTFHFDRKRGNVLTMVKRRRT